MSHISLYPADAERYLQGLSKDLHKFPVEFKRAVLAALKRAGLAVHKGSKAKISKRYSVPGGIAPTLNLYQASPKRLAAEVMGRSRRLSLARYESKERDVSRTPKTYVRHTRKGPVKIAQGKRSYRAVSVKIYKGKRRWTVDNAFMARANKGKEKGQGFRHIFKRFPDKSINVMRGPSFVNLLNKQENYQELKDLGQMVLWQRLQHEADYRLGKLGAGK